MSDPTLKQIQEDAARQAILDNAIKIIAKEGVQSLSMRSLARQVGCSPATLYKYFENKDGLLEAIRQEGWRLMGELDASYDFTSLSPIESLKLSGKIFQEFPQKYPDHYMLMFGSMDAAQMSAEYILADENFHGLVQLLDGAMKAGLVTTKVYTPEELAFHIWILSHGIAMLRLTILRDDQKFIQISDQVLEAFARSLTN